MTRIRRALSLVVALASLVAAWALTQPFHHVVVATTGGDERLLHTGITHHSWGLMFVPTAIVLAAIGIAGAWSARPRARTFAIATGVASIAWSLVVLTDGLLTDYLMTRESALFGEQVFVAARIAIALAGVPLLVVAARERA
ncbi:hypothetical protein [Sandaracinus amylolyticus]|uniref:Uncharacterized protein n=1 Tax=Sandaracinus amylolyticus TaxID=927083 RepID=A0A0F6W4S4_9BACT|nr:hypothetical protein [Sandaracinus amylolyticus]AKF07398.1 hypothetical protein DB32_004547 [Sandaracinus amylolyticus]